MITPDFTAYAFRAHAHFSHPLPSELVRRRVEGMMTKITLQCVKEGVDLIGHIKSVTETEGKGFLTCSVVEPNGVVQSKGELKDGIDEIEVVLNVLLYGLKREQVARIAERAARSELGVEGGHLEIEDLEEDHDHCHEEEHSH